MIAIINDGSNNGSTGLHHYRVQINQDIICEFDHIREEGLAVCLRKAADAVEKYALTEEEQQKKRFYAFLGSLLSNE